MEETLNRTQSEISTPLDNLPEAICRIDRELRCVYANRACAALFGLARGTLIPEDREIADRLPARARHRWAATCRLVLKSGRPARLRLEAWRGGGLRSYALRIVPEFGAGSTVRSLLSIARDLSDRGRVTKPSSPAAPGLAHLSHEFRPRLNATLGGTRFSRAAAAGDPRERLAGLRILAVDDDRNTRDMLEEALTRAGARVWTADSAHTAFEQLQRCHPDVLISDIGMPDEDGYALMRKVRALPVRSGGRTPAIALTGYARDDKHTAARKAGYQAVAIKPVALEELMTTILAVAALR